MKKSIRINAAMSLAQKKGKQPRFEILAYTGGIMNIAGWGPVVIDLAGCSLPKTVPVLVDHDNSLKGVIGSGRPEISRG